jgi:hypothetical protein
MYQNQIGLFCLKGSIEDVEEAKQGVFKVQHSLSKQAQICAEGCEGGNP